MRYIINEKGKIGNVIYCFNADGIFIENNGAEISPLTEAFIRLIKIIEVRFYIYTNGSKSNLESIIERNAPDSDFIKILSSTNEIDAIDEIREIENVFQTRIAIVSDNPQTLIQVKKYTAAKALAIPTPRYGRQLFQTCEQLEIPLTFTAFTAIQLIQESTNRDFVEEYVFKNYKVQEDHTIIKADQNIRELAWKLSGSQCSTSVFGQDPDRAIACRLIENILYRCFNSQTFPAINNETAKEIWRRNFWIFCESCSKTLTLQVVKIHSGILNSNHSLNQVTEFGLQKDFYVHGKFQFDDTTINSMQSSLKTAIVEMLREALTYWTGTSGIIGTLLKQNCVPLTHFISASEEHDFLQEINWENKDDLENVLSHLIGC
jgi:hypothetical protein